MKKTFYLTTPLYYPSDNLHIGHAYSSTVADSMSEYKRMRGYDVRFLTGTDDHGQKIETIARDKNMAPKAYVDGIVQSIYTLWDKLDIKYDAFVRTTDENHVSYIKKVFIQLYEQGDIYKGKYEGYYCTPCESFFTELQLVDGKCPDCHREVELISEDAYFFKLSNYTDRLMEHIDKHPDFIQPAFRKREMIENFLKPGLSDISVTRTSISWGVPVPFDPEHVIYVWIDALSGYISSLNRLTADESLYERYWPADIHLVGKEIVRFHTIIWPALLMALDLPLPKQVYAHGFWLTDGDKMSKSKGNVVDPLFLIDRYGRDATRYYFLREMTLGQDASFSYEGFLKRTNADLANDLGNLLSRTTSMIEMYFDNTLIENHIGNEFDQSVRELAAHTVTAVEDHMDKLEFHKALENIWALVRRMNKYVDETKPWVLGKDENKKGELANVLYYMAETLRIVSILLRPMLIDSPKEIANQLQITDAAILTWESAHEFGLLPKNNTSFKGDILFPRIDVEKELKALRLLSPTIDEGEAPQAAKKELPKDNKKATEAGEPITYGDFMKTKLVVGHILSCEKVEGADKLLLFQVDIGAEQRQIVSGIAEFYNPVDLIGKKVLVVKNLQPAKIFGLQSEGMILSSENSQGHLQIVEIDPTVETGSGVS